jgi:uncharacterized protein (DUF302 family)
MSNFGRRLVIDLPFEAALGETTRALRAEGFEVLARIDVRDQFRRGLGHDFRQYYVLEAWSSQLAVEALAHELDAGTLLPTRVVVYELADGETAVVIAPPLWPLREDFGWRAGAPELAEMADIECSRAARVADRICRVEHAQLTAA